MTTIHHRHYYYRSHISWIYFPHHRLQQVTNSALGLIPHFPSQLVPTLSDFLTAFVLQMILGLLSFVASTADVPTSPFDYMKVPMRELSQKCGAKAIVPGGRNIATRIYLLFLEIYQARAE